MSGCAPKINHCIVMVILSIFCVSCSVSELVVNEDREGEIPKSFFKQLKDDYTTKKWVASILGMPTNYEQIDEDFELATYEYERAHYKNANALVVFNYSGVQRDKEYLHLIFKNNVLKKHWVDQFAIVQAHQYEDLRKEKKTLLGFFSSERKPAKQKYTPVSEPVSKTGVIPQEKMEDHSVEEKEKERKTLLRMVVERFKKPEKQMSEKAVTEKISKGAMPEEGMAKKEMMVPPAIERSAVSTEIKPGEIQPKIEVFDNPEGESEAGN